ncbi:MAG: GNAT family N-acetyltransferase [Planctomycetes bacterium]|nr:GNAT family N-acetyltransferase [Planctomycetota bacterium]
MLIGTEAFRPDEIPVAMELIDIGLSPGGGGYRFVVAELADAPGRVAGYACFGATPCTLGTFDLYWIAVDKSLQGHGIGKALVRSVEDVVGAERGRLILIETGGKPSYAAQRAFYLSAGYREVARVPDFYEDGDDRVIYQKRVR